MSTTLEYGDPHTRERILEAAWDLLLEAGPEIRLADVSKRAGLSRQSLYLHFGNRAQLLLEVLAWGDQRLELATMLAGVEQAASGIEALERIIQVHAVYSPRIDAVARALEEDQYRDKAVAAALRNQLDVRRNTHEAVITRIAAEGALGGIVKTCGWVCLRLLADLLVVDLGRWFVRRVCR